jgi:hypothetical protein
MELSKLLEKLSEKYPDEPMLDEAMALADEDLMAAGDELDIGDETEMPPEEDYEDSGDEELAMPDFDELAQEDMSDEDLDGMDDDGYGDDDVDVVPPVAMASKRKKKPGMMA